MHEFIRYNSPPVSIDSDLVLWVGITAQKRSWMEQIEGQYRIVQALRKHHSSITVIVDGWISLADGVPDSPKDIARDMAVYESLNKRLGKLKNVNVINVIGKDYNEKVSYAQRVDYFIANSGTGGMVPMMFAKAKGVIHSNSKLHTFSRAYNSTVEIVPNEKIMAQDLSLDSGVYSIDWKVIYNLLMKLMSLEERLTESSVLKNKLYFNFKRFIFKKNIQIGMAIKKLKLRAS
ncbi:hypothetical protein [Vibrio ziniensis]|uniref:Uncharacterized protein n=1 Tax=Vibrio ziniensis TaxID=2711221 RepID=A0A6G7CLM3_9VIBR|nr:hypothetical protein [Vibrio ziniensis]QIH43002.1 hypothetical protein G5S32_14075 [Vibrio ziniensis]